MLNRIEIKNFATIENLSFDLGNKLNIITGETGAGKSILVQAISTVLGDRADTSLVRTGSDKALIQLACTHDGKDIIITREILSSGKSISKINGEMVTLAQVKELCSDIVDIHGQYDNQQILNPDNHINITDRFQIDVMKPELEKFSILYNGYREAKKEYDELIQAETNAKQQKDYFEYEYNYINSLNLNPNEDDELSDKLDIMRNSEKIYTSVSSSYDALYNNEDSIMSKLSYIKNELESVSNYAENLGAISKQIQDVYYELEDVSGGLRDMTNTLTFSEEDLNSTSERLSSIEDAKRKYNKNLEEIIAYGEELEKKLGMIQNFDYKKSQIEEKVKQRYELLQDQAEHLSELRHIIANKLESSMISELQDLDFANSDFKINIEKLEEIGPNGFDKIEFSISTNPGEPLMPLTKIASGGEISRIMLAFKHIIGNSDQVETMIFDEIDTGISGKTALVVGNKLKEISTHHQIVCITHLPQIAANGDDNYLVTKDIFDSKSHTVIEHLDIDGKIKMVATLFSGSTDENAIEAAKELINKVN